jgi:hypothetical protein
MPPEEWPRQNPSVASLIAPSGSAASRTATQSGTASARRVVAERRRNTKITCHTARGYRASGHLRALVEVCSATPCSASPQKGIYRPTWSSAILEELEYHEAKKLVQRSEERVVVIGIGATAVILAPAMADRGRAHDGVAADAEHAGAEEDAVANLMRRVLGEKRGYAATRRKEHRSAAGDLAVLQAVP